MKSFDKATKPELEPAPKTAALSTLPGEPSSPLAVQNIPKSVTKSKQREKLKNDKSVLAQTALSALSDTKVRDALERSNERIMLTEKQERVPQTSGKGSAGIKPSKQMARFGEQLMRSNEFQLNRKPSTNERTSLPKERYSVLELDGTIGLQPGTKASEGVNMQVERRVQTQIQSTGPPEQ